MSKLKLSCVFPSCGYVTDELIFDQARIMLEMHRKYVHPEVKISEENKSEKNPRPIIDLDCSEEDWSRFLIKWNKFKEENTIKGPDLIRELNECVGPSLRKSELSTQFIKTEQQLLDLMKLMAVRYQNPLLHFQEFLSLSQNQDERVQHYLARLRAVALKCQFTQKCECEKEVSFVDTLVRYRLVTGLFDEEIRNDMLANDKSLEKTITEVEAMENEKDARYCTSFDQKHKTSQDSVVSEAEDSEGTKEDTSQEEIQPNMNGDADGTKEMLYCLCNQPAGDEFFMIECDNCKNWFHGRCVGVSEDQTKELQETEWKCPPCSRGQTDDPNLDLYEKTDDSNENFIESTDASNNVASDKTEDSHKGVSELAETNKKTTSGDCIEDFLPNADEGSDEDSREKKDFKFCSECKMKVERKMFKIHMKKLHKQSRQQSLMNKLTECSYCGQFVFQQFLPRHIKQKHCTSSEEAKSRSKQVLKSNSIASVCKRSRIDVSLINLDYDYRNDKTSTNILNEVGEKCKISGCRRKTLFTTNNKLLHHYANVHFKDKLLPFFDEESLTCSLCPDKKKFSTVQYLLSHVGGTHKKLKPYLPEEEKNLFKIKKDKRNKENYSRLRSKMAKSTEKLPEGNVQENETRAVVDKESRRKLKIKNDKTGGTEVTDLKNSNKKKEKLKIKPETGNQTKVNFTRRLPDPRQSSEEVYNNNEEDGTNDDFKISSVESIAVDYRSVFDDLSGSDSELLD